jgi:hypothetical protein
VNYINSCGVPTLWDQPIKFNKSQTRGWDGIQLLSRISKFIPKSEQNQDQLAPLRSTPPLFKTEKFKYKNVKSFFENMIQESGQY